MKRKNPDISFSAYVGTDERPAQERARPSAQQTARGRSGKNEARQAAQQPRRRWPLLLTGVVCLLLTAGASAVAVQYREPIADYLNRPVASVRMETPLQRVGEMEVRSVLALYLDEGFFGLDADALRNHLEEHPWVEQAVVRRVWPDVLAIAIYEETPIARWGDSQLLNQSAQVFTPAEIGESSALPVLRGPEGEHQQMMEQYRIFNQLLLDAGLRIRELSLNERGSWSVTVNDGLLINIGREQVLERLQRFISLYDRVIDTKTDVPVAIDLRYRNGISVARKAAVEVAER